jgi:ribosomal protein S18 acetylase RimI-like enzyme
LFPVTHKETHLNTVSPATLRLRESDRAALITHFLGLGAEDRRLRFGSPLRDEGLQAYVARIDFERDGLFAVHDDELKLLAVVHVAFSEGSAELGLSVLPGFRGQGLGSALLVRAIVHLRNRGSAEVFVHCLTENAAMMHLARKHGMRVIPAGAETDARLAIEPPTPHTHFLEWLHEQQGQFAQAVRHQARFSRAVLGIFSPS